MKPLLFALGACGLIYGFTGLSEYNSLTGVEGMSQRMIHNLPMHGPFYDSLVAEAEKIMFIGFGAAAAFGIAGFAAGSKEEGDKGEEAAPEEKV